ncbi:transcriptional regulator, IclR family [Fictibacillus solisalsi]|uniref:Glycerol operon regulatory protein n=1 Tax=Fictibacillus solisalsi TaxID=459525 RepID=A0A1G9YEF0_9BACL|nr:IclR family transcriptional regulator [Fictibacillus solisalsi]SDN06855.1 transcriptional regulator, IclR family [Fictibacillus solisalsi]
MNDNDTGKGIRTLQRSIDILECFTYEQPELTLTEISKKIELAKSTTTRLLATLEQNGLVQKDGNTLKYRLGKKLYFWGQIAEKTIEIKETAKPFMEKLRDDTRETVTLYLLEGHQRVCVQRFGSKHSVQHIVKVGEQLPLWAGAGGKAILAFQDEDFIERELTSVPGEQGEKLINELAVIRQTHSSYSFDERGIGVSGAAAPVFNVKGEVKASIGISGPSIRFTPDIVETYQEMVKDVALEVSNELGYQGKS